MRTNQRTGVSTFASPASPSTRHSLQRSFHLSYADKIELKKISFSSENKKYATTQPDTTLRRNMNNGLQGLTTRTTGYNTVLPQWGLTCFYETFVHKQTAVHLLNICAKNPPLRQYPKRYR